MSRASLYLSALLAAAGILAGCKAAQREDRSDYPMGERVSVGPLTYNVVETAWRSQLGAGFNTRLPERRFLLISISVTNGGGHDISVPLLKLENQNRQSFSESNDGEGVDNWFGLLRTISPAQTLQGRILFDVALASYKLHLTDAGEPGTEKSAWVDIPISLDADPEGDSATPGNIK